jgi:hypothetical protein
MAKYDPLRHYLARLPGSETSLEFDEVSELVNGLPPSALRHHEWWANDESHVQGQAWLKAGWLVRHVDLTKREVQFRIDDGRGTRLAKHEGDKSAEPTPEGRPGLYLRFWALYFERLRELHPEWVGNRNPVASSWVGQRSNIPDTFISVCFGRNGTLRHELYIDSGEKAANKTLFESLLEERTAIEEVYGRQLDFQRLPARRGCRIADHGTGDVTNEESWPRFVEWFLDAGVRLRRALSSFGA